MVHGLEGSGEAGYMQSLSAAALRAGFAGHCLPFGSTVKTGIRARGLDKLGQPWHSRLDDRG
jgi:predicted alpha/beta-fold hydrolase